ncbi:transposase [Photobacterium sp. WH77]|uniref:transposase n=1 Tax=unclassified Photobacterium TaxID=2628852 RepID=UPI001EDBA510|nr:MULTISPECIES: transposase [unclassified Photobacterium]MCG2836379.1 transposase [Photobacterium sp. WH77]MCG2843994.1 transposase [Photobacterium sp. WH80]
MTTARSQLVSVEATPYYHCVSRCVRRSFLCGYDELTQTSYEHRRGWVEKRLKRIASVFCVDVCAYAIMSNHYHVVLHINKDQAYRLSNHEVIDRWLTLHRAPMLIQQFLKSENLSEIEQNACLAIIQTWRERLCSISWFMRLLNQYIASEANREDNCTGHFWEGRFKSQALLDEKALAAAMAYVDLNPIRAGIADTPEASSFTSVKARIESHRKDQITAPSLFPFAGNPRNDMPEGLPFSLADYLELVDWTGQQVRGDKSGHIQSAQLPILERLGIKADSWLDVCTNIKKCTLIGSAAAIQTALPKFNRQRRTALQIP